MLLYWLFLILIEFILETDASGIGLGAIWPKNSQMGQYSLLLMVAEHYNNMRRNMELGMGRYSILLKVCDTIQYGIAIVCI